MRKIKTSDLVKTALAAAVICVLAPISFKIGTVPITLATLAVYFVSAVVGKYRGTVAVLLYIALGAIGIPVFSSFSGGIAKLIGPTGGYIVGYIPCAFIVGFMVDKMKEKKWVYPASMVLGTIACYILGTAWYMIATETPFVTAVSACILPFIPVDTAKIVIASLLGYNIRKTVDKM